jgi:hypothetical protein
MDSEEDDREGRGYNIEDCESHQSFWLPPEEMMEPARHATVAGGCGADHVVPLRG